MAGLGLLAGYSPPKDREEAGPLTIERNTAAQSAGLYSLNDQHPTVAEVDQLFRLKPNVVPLSGPSPMRSDTCRFRPERYPASAAGGSGQDDEGEFDDVAVRLAVPRIDLKVSIGAIRTRSEVLVSASRKVIRLDPLRLGK